MAGRGGGALGGGRGGIGKLIGAGIDKRGARGKLITDAAAVPITYHGLTNGTGDREANARAGFAKGVRASPGSGRLPEQKSHKIGTRKTAAVVVDLAELYGLQQPAVFGKPVIAFTRWSGRHGRRVRH